VRYGTAAKGETMSTTEVRDLLEFQRLLMRSVGRTKDGIQSAFDHLNEMTEEETRELVSTEFVEALLKAHSAIGDAEEALLRGVRA
jgi:hypothetical protein